MRDSHRCAQVRAWLLDPRLAPTAWVPDALCSHVASCAVCQGAVALVIIVQTGIRPEPMTCRACQALLPTFAEITRDDRQEARSTMPSVWWHLLCCAECAEVFQMMQRVLYAERQGPLMSPLTCGSTERHC